MLNTSMLKSDIASDLDCAAKLLQEGKLVAVPTETVYGLAADATNAEAVRKIFIAKGRPADHPLIVHLPDATAMSNWAADIPEAAYKLAAAFWPGPLTLLLPKAEHVDACVTGGLDSIGLRVSAHPVLLKLLTSAKLAVAAPSANPYKRLSATSAQQVLETMAGKIDAVLDGGQCEFGLESTIVSLISDKVQVLRAGPISAEEIAEVLGCEVETPKQHQVKVSGNVAAHYQPKTKLCCATTAELPTLLANSTQKVAVLALNPLAKAPFWQYQMPQDVRAYGRELYKQLYQADLSGAELIVVETPPTDNAWLAVQNRLMRAAFQEQ